MKRVKCRASTAPFRGGKCTTYPSQSKANGTSIHTVLHLYLTIALIDVNYIICEKYCSPVFVYSLQGTIHNKGRKGRNGNSSHYYLEIQMYSRFLNFPLLFYNSVSLQKIHYIPSLLNYSKYRVNTHQSQTISEKISISLVLYTSARLSKHSDQ